MSRLIFPPTVLLNLPGKDITWEETESEYIIKLKPTISTSAMMTPILACKDLSLGSSVAFLTT